MKLIVNADDFGISKAVTLGILEAHKNGIVKSTTLMCNMEDAEYAANLSKNYNDLGVGIHFVLTAGKPLSKDAQSLVDENGNFKSNSLIMKTAKIEDIRKEFNAQFEKFLSFGIKPTHIDSHHHVHKEPMVFEVVMEFSKKYNLPIRKVNDKSIDKLKKLNKGMIFTEEFYGKENIESKHFINLLIKNKDTEFLEIMCHPAYLDEKILNSSSYLLERTKELSTLTSGEIKEYIKDNKIKLINYANI